MSIIPYRSDLETFPEFVSDASFKLMTNTSGLFHYSEDSLAEEKQLIVIESQRVNRMRNSTPSDREESRNYVKNLLKKNRKNFEETLVDGGVQTDESL